MRGVLSKLRFGRILLFLVLVPILLILGIRKLAMTPQDVALDLRAVTQIGEGMKITVTPLRRLADRRVLFLVRRESYEYQDLLDGDLKETSLLLDEFETPSVPVSWKETGRETGSVTGELIFPFSPTSSVMTLTFDDLEETVFSWKVSKK